jgi:hypothetical protein
MGIGRLLVIIATLVMSFIGTIFLESKMEQFAVLELVIIVVAILLSIIALIGIAAESRWSWAFATILFSLMLANSVFLFVNVPALITFVLLIIVNIFGMLVSVLSIEDSSPSVVSTAPAEETPHVEPYVEEPSAEVTYKEPKRGRRKKRK